VYRGRSFSNILPEKHAPTHPFDRERHEVARASGFVTASFGRFNKSARSFIDYHSELVL
jgi:hypothetical protein